MTWCLRILAIAAYVGICELVLAVESSQNRIPALVAFALLPASAAALLAVIGERRRLPDQRVFGPALLVVVLAASIATLRQVPPFSELACLGIFGVAIQALLAVPLVLLALRLARRIQPPCVLAPATEARTGLVDASPCWQLGAITTYVVTHQLLAVVLPVVGTSPPTPSPLVPAFGAAAIQLIVPATFAGVVATAGSQRRGARALTALPNALRCVVIGAFAVVLAYALQWRWLEASMAYPSLLAWPLVAIGLQVLCATPLMLALDLLFLPRSAAPSPS